jgi:competence protein ComEC
VLLPVWATSLATGIVLGIALGHAALVGTTVVGLCVALALVHVRAWYSVAAMVVLGIGIWLGRHEVACATRPPSLPEDTPVEIDGQITRGADVSNASAASTGAASGRAQTSIPVPPRPWRCHVWLELSRVSGKPASGTVRLSILDRVPELAPGDWVHLSTRLFSPRGAANPGLPDARLLARAQGIDWLATVRSAADIHRLPGRASLVGLLRRAAFRARLAMARAIDHAMAEPIAGFVRTMVIGERTEVSEQIEDGFRAAGATHALSVSGLHLAVVVALVYQLLCRLIARVPSWALRIAPAQMAAALSLPVCVLYTMLTGEAVATVRSAIMAGVVLMATVVNRPFALCSGIATAAILLLATEPLTVLDVSFQLSFASVIGLGLFARWLVPRSHSRRQGWFRRVRTWLLASLSASCAASLVTAPLVAHHFGEITPAAPIGNLALVPIVELLVLPCGLVGALLGVVHPWLGALPLGVASAASRLALALAELFRLFAPVLLVAFPTWFEVAMLTVTAGCMLRGLARETMVRKRWIVLATVASTLWLGSFLAREAARWWRTEVVVTFMDVGQGDATLIEGPHAFTVLIDGGGSYDNSFDTGARIVEPFLRARGITRLDAVILSHPHPDHMNGLFRVLGRFSVGALWTNGDGCGNPAYDALVRLANQRGIAIPIPTSLSKAGLRLEALGPKVGTRIGVPAGLGANDASLVVRLSFARRRVLFVGDLGSEGEAELLDLGLPKAALSSDLLKVPHHGSRYASGEDFLDAVSPKLAVASAGRFNRFGLPNPVALARYARRRIPVLRTDDDGAVSVTIGARGRTSVTCARRSCRY